MSIFGVAPKINSSHNLIQKYKRDNGEQKQQIRNALLSHITAICEYIVEQNIKRASKILE